MTTPDWPTVETIETARLVLEPLRVEHADEMVTALDDERLHGFTGGKPATRDELWERYARQVAGRSADGTQGWFNWVARHRESGSVVGFVQATLEAEDGRTFAEIAWVISVPAQGQGYAREAAAALAGWLRTSGVDVLLAHVHPDHLASNAVAGSLGLSPTDIVVDGETRWTS